MNRPIAALCLLALAAPLSVRADDGPTPQEIAAAKARTVSAQGLVDLFDQSCVSHADSLAQLRIWLDLHATQANEQQTAYFLNNMQGKVWINRNKSGNYAIVVNDQMGLCTVKAEKGPVGEVAAFVKADKTLQQMNVKQTGDSADGNFMGVSGHVYMFSFSHIADDYMIVLVGHDKADIPLQSQLTLAPQGAAPELAPDGGK